MSSKLESDVDFLARVAPSGECLRGEGLAWLIGAVVCLLAACRGSNCTLIGWPKYALQNHWRSCQSTAVDGCTYAADDVCKPTPSTMFECTSTREYARLSPVHTNNNVEATFDFVGKRQQCRTKFRLLDKVETN